jgi:hypothetical protein
LIGCHSPDAGHLPDLFWIWFVLFAEAFTADLVHGLSGAAFTAGFDYAAALGIFGHA